MSSTISASAAVPGPESARAESSGSDGAAQARKSRSDFSALSRPTKHRRSGNKFVSVRERADQFWGRVPNRFRSVPRKRGEGRRSGKKKSSLPVPKALRRSLRELNGENASDPSSHRGGVRSNKHTSNSAPFTVHVDRSTSKASKEVRDEARSRNVGGTRTGKAKRRSKSIASGEVEIASASANFRSFLAKQRRRQSHQRSEIKIFAPSMVVADKDGKKQEGTAAVEEEHDEVAEEEEGEEEQSSIAGVNMSEILECLGKTERQHNAPSCCDAVSMALALGEEEKELEEVPTESLSTVGAKVEEEEDGNGKNFKSTPKAAAATIEMKAIDAELRAVEEASATAAAAADELKSMLGAAAAAVATTAATTAAATTTVAVNAGDNDDDNGAIDSAVASKAVASATFTPGRLAAESYALLDGMSEGIDAALLDIDAMMAEEQEVEERAEGGHDAVVVVAGEEEEGVEEEFAPIANIGSADEEEEDLEGEEEETECVGESESAAHWRHVRRFTSMLQ